MDCFEEQITIINLSWSVLEESNENDNFKTVRTFSRNFSNIQLFLKMLPLKGDDFVLERPCPKERLSLSESGFVSEEGHSPKILQLEL